MKILVLNGSPKGSYSITLQTVLYLEKKHPEHKFEILNVGSQIRSLERDFTTAVEAIERAELILFSYPVYTFIAPSQLHRFVELMKASGIDFNGKYATQLSTSKHFYDVTAHKYIQENCQDIGMRFIKGLSADMEDLLSKKGQKNAEDFFAYVCWCVENSVYEALPKPLGEVKHIPVAQLENTTGKPGNVVLVADLNKEDTQLGNMISRFMAKLPLNSTMINIAEFPFKGGCLGCFSCAIDGKCIYKDGFDSFLRENIQTADAIVIAFSIKDHSMGSRFKTYDDRQFCNGHRTVTMGMPFGYLISGNYSKEANLQLIVEGRAEVGGNFLAGVATDEFDPDNEIDKLADRLNYAIKHRYVQPSNFLGVGGMKIFRDLIWLMQGMMRADHRFYKAHKQYDFPQKKRGTMLKMYLVGALIRNPKLKAKMGNKMNEGMLAPYKKVIEAKAITSGKK